MGNDRDLLLLDDCHDEKHADVEVESIAITQYDEFEWCADIHGYDQEGSEEDLDGVGADTNGMADAEYKRRKK